MSENSDQKGAESSPRSGERIAKLLARAGIASRREVERMIGDGRVKLDNVVLTTPATILTDLRGVTVDDKPVAAPERTRLFAFHKPPGLITAERDPAGRPTIYNALVNALPPGTPRLMPVGRLDFSTEGLLLLTNDGEFKRELELPATGVPRTYRARAFGNVTQTQLEELAEGVTVDGMHYGRIIADMERRTGRNGWLVMTLTEGKNREVRRVLEHLELEVSRLIRTAYGPFHLGDLARGGAVEIKPVDLERFRAALKTGSFTGLKQIAMTNPDRPEPVRAAPKPSRPVRWSADKRAAAPAERKGDRRAPNKAAPAAPEPAKSAQPRQAPHKVSDDGVFSSGGRRNAAGPRRSDREPERGERKPERGDARPPRGSGPGGKPPSRTPRGRR